VIVACCQLEPRIIVLPELAVSGYVFADRRPELYA
jgi:predicted amidohydrolase